ncbi:IQ motif and ankyrin repeat domain-containing protein 1-like [Physella acuta]|uniref:IQ motif and ankyrin repeat domain-containing protein 1-like n=1 Tax=Physella acuta TaxID=109671 RepID=UPI0027DE9847|nr:IQ motif and ankyrin repeat domain-containing protein 1-like [Physella acuta]XP_059144992.1 IQ motif and ankyrin repeat domain-containing protein 1-like [Physella acuta]
MPMPPKPAAKKPAPVKPKGKLSPDNSKKQKPKGSPENEAQKEREIQAAIQIQTTFRKFMAKKELEKRKVEKFQYAEQMDKIEREAYLYMVKLDQEQNERKRLKEEEEKKIKLEETKRKKRMLEAAYDGDVGVMKQILKEVEDADNAAGIAQDVVGKCIRAKHQLQLVECEDANANTALSEAANGGHAAAIKFLLDQGADPNTVGQFNRTPLYRAAFGGHLEAVLVLLDHGADPRIHATDNQNPTEIASTPAVKDVLEKWNIERTEALLKSLQAVKDQRMKAEQLKNEAEKNRLEKVLEEAEKAYDAKVKQLQHAYCELNKRIHEHDKCQAEGFAKPEITLQAIHDQELEVETIKTELETAKNNLSKARLALRESKKRCDDDDEDDLPGIKVIVKELDDVLFRDVGNRLKQSGKWPFIIDLMGQATTFLRYRDTNYICTLRPSDMEINNIRRCLLGAIRYGKPFVLDMMEVDMFDTCVDKFDEVSKGLMASIMDKSILNEEKYSKLIKPTDGPDYEKTKFNDLRISNFLFILVTKNPFPSVKLLEAMYVIRVVVPV